MKRERPKTVSLKITNCLDCPHHNQKPSPPTGDSFDMVDVDTFCTLEGRNISVSDRPWQVRENCAVPKWCPL